MAIPLLPYLDPAPVGVPLVDPKTGMITPTWNIWYTNLQRVVFGVWKDVPFDAANFTCAGLGAWMVASANVKQCSVYQMGPLAIAIILIEGTTVTVDTAILSVTLPTLRQLPDSTIAVFQTIGGSRTLPGGYEPAFVYVENVPTGTPAQVHFEQLDGGDFLAASAGVDVWGIAIFECLSVVVP